MARHIGSSVGRHSNQLADAAAFVAEADDFVSDPDDVDPPSPADEPESPDEPELDASFVDAPSDCLASFFSFLSLDSPDALRESVR